MMYQLTSKIVLEASLITYLMYYIITYEYDVSNYIKDCLRAPLEIIVCKQSVNDYALLGKCIYRYEWSPNIHLLVILFVYYSTSTSLQQLFAQCFWDVFSVCPLYTLNKQPINVYSLLQGCLQSLSITYIKQAANKCFLIIFLMFMNLFYFKYFINIEQAYIG